MKDKIFLNNDWEFLPDFNQKMTEIKYKGKMQKVRIPHTVKELPFNGFDESLYQTLACYRKTFKTDKSWKGKRVLLTFDGVAHEAELFINGKLVTKHGSGYTAFTSDITDFLLPTDKNNVVVLKVDSRETVNIPPFGFVIDYMTYGGIYRDVYLEIKNSTYIEDVFVKTEGATFTTEVTLNSDDIPSGLSVSQTVTQVTNKANAAEINTGVPGRKLLTTAKAQPVIQWSPDTPELYILTTKLFDAKGKIVDTKTTRFGFRDIRFDESGFYLNGKKIKLRGLNRHQAYPYVGYAMPKRMQYDDAEILKYDLNLNYVRTSHYPQSQHFIDRCDELGLLVFTEFPGWQHIGDDAWKNQALENEKEMILQYRNHPSIFMWGVRINESKDDDDFYEKTNALSHTLDPSRPTGGVRCIKKSHLLEDVYTYNDFSHSGKNSGSVKKTEVTDTHAGYMVSEYNGHMFPTKTFDTEERRTEHAIRHATVLDSVAFNDDCAGASGWCAFDYNTHKEFGSGDRICYHGVMDMFRNPKLASSVYKSFSDPEKDGVVLDVSSNMSIGEYNAGVLGDIWIFTNAPSVRLSVNGVFIKEYTHKDSPFKNIPHGPIYVDDVIGERLEKEDGIPKKYASTVKEIIYAIKKYGVEALPLKYKMKVSRLSILRVISLDRLNSLFGKYISNWGGTAPTYVFEAVLNGKTVKTLTKAMCVNACLKAEVKRTCLIEDESYDVTEIHLFSEDENGNIQPFVQEAVSVKAEGVVDIIGPSAVSLKGGMAGIYVKSIGKTGKGSINIKDWTGKETKILFTVKSEKS